MPWKGIKFDETGQNLLGTPVMLQMKDGVYHTVWPESVAVTPLIWKVGQ
jgi:branched-chain amino acid transport system substrate-binding protein